MQVKSCTANCNSNSGTWSAWTTVGSGTFRGKPSAVSRGSGLNDIFVQGMDGTLWATSYHSTGAGSFYQVRTDQLGWNASCPECYSPAADARGTSLLDVTVRGQDDKAWITTWSGGSSWSGYSPLGGVLASSPGTVSRVRDSNRIDLIVFMKEETTTGTWTMAPWWDQTPAP